MASTVIEVGQLMHWQRQLMNARGGQEQAFKRGDDELAVLFQREAKRAEAEREAAILALRVAGVAP